MTSLRATAAAISSSRSQAQQGLLLRRPSFASQEFADSYARGSATGGCIRLMYDIAVMVRVVASDIPAVTVWAAIKFSSICHLGLHRTLSLRFERCTLCGTHGSVDETGTLPFCVIGLYNIYRSCLMTFVLRPGAPTIFPFRIDIMRRTHLSGAPFNVDF